MDDPYPVSWRLSWKDWHPQSKGNPASRHICRWFSLGSRFWSCQASTIIWVHVLKSMSPLVFACLLTLSFSHSSSLPFLTYFYFIWVCCVVYACTCVCTGSCAFVWMCVEVRGQCWMSSPFLIVALSLNLKHTNSADYLSSSSWYSPVSASPELLSQVHTTTPSFLHGAGDRKPGLNKHSKHITNQTISLAVLPFLRTLTNPSTLPLLCKAVHTTYTITSGVTPALPPAWTT